ncbi:hypothetical protein [Breznakibacter xylanolyticus]|nr:hypothetical protein [Breznakibacter xylanolyticus]
MLPSRLPSPDEVGQERGALIKPGTIFIINHGSGRGHTGIVVSPRCRTF